MLNANSNNALLISLCDSLKSDSIVDELKKYTYRRSKYISKVFELVGHKEFDKFINSKSETVESFLKYCVRSWQR